MKCAVQHQKWLGMPGNQFAFKTIPAGIGDYSACADAERKPGIACQINESWARRSDSLDNVLLV
jgi:hypothetical protein